jgi:hypothetical protein
MRGALSRLLPRLWRLRHNTQKFKFGTLKDVLTDDVVNVIEAPPPGHTLDAMLHGPIDFSDWI